MASYNINNGSAATIFVADQALPHGANLQGVSLTSAQVAALQATAGVSVTAVGGSVTSSQATLSTTASLVVAARPGRTQTTFINHSSIDVYLGPSGVTAANGILLAGTKGTQITIPGGAALYGIAASGTPAVGVVEAY